MPITDPVFDALDWTTAFRGTALNLTGYVETFRDDFTVEEYATSTVCKANATGARCKWYAPTRQFGGATFTYPDITPSNFVHGPGRLSIRLSHETGSWKSGHIRTTNLADTGFHQSLGYFECKARFPMNAGPPVGGVPRPGAGTWPAFWLRTDFGVEPDLEVDVLEAYGGDIDGHHAAIHLDGVYHKGDFTNLTTAASAVDVGNPLLFPTSHDMFNTCSFRTYGCLIDPDIGIVIYYENKEITRFPWSDYFDTPLHIMANLALNPGEPTDTSTKVMHIDYIRAMAKA